LAALRASLSAHSEPEQECPSGGNLRALELPVVKLPLEFTAAAAD
jgi:hypothetical protein